MTATVYNGLRSGLVSYLRWCLRPLFLFDDLILHMVADALDIIRFVVAKIASTVRSMIGLPLMLVWAFLELVSFAIVLGAPAYIVSRTLYRKDAHLIRTVSYGSHASERMDIYLPSDDLTSESRLPVIIFIQGGGWTLCKREFYPALGHSFRKRGYITVIPSYRTFPQVRAGDILTDIHKCIQYTALNIREMGGNPDRIYLMGQSAGAHLIALAVLKELERHHSSHGLMNGVSLGLQSCRPKRSLSSPSITKMTKSTWSYSGIKGVILISGVYDIVKLDQNLCAQGREHINGLRDVFGGKEHYVENSPDYVLKRLIENRRTGLGLEVPNFIFIHGTRDRTCLYSAAQEFHERLREAHFATQFVTYEGQSHLESIMEVLEGHGESRLVQDVIHLIEAPTKVCSAPSSLNRYRQSSELAHDGISCKKNGSSGCSGDKDVHEHNRTSTEANIEKMVAFAEAEMLRASQLWRIKSYVMHVLCPV